MVSRNEPHLTMHSSRAGQRKFGRDLEPGTFIILKKVFWDPTVTLTATVASAPARRYSPTHPASTSARHGEHRAGARYEGYNPCVHRRTVHATPAHADAALPLVAVQKASVPSALLVPPLDRWPFRYQTYWPRHDRTCKTLYSYYRSSSPAATFSARDQAIRDGDTPAIEHGIERWAGAGRRSSQSMTAGLQKRA